MKIENELVYKVEIHEHGVFIINQGSEFYRSGDVPEFWKSWIPASFGFPVKRGKRIIDEQAIIKARKLCRALNIYANSTGEYI